MPRPRILATLSDSPWPPDRGKRIRAGTTVSALAAVGDVDLLVLSDDQGTGRRPPGLTLRSEQHVRLPLAARTAAARAAAHLLPWQIAVRDWSGARAALRALGTAHDLVWFGATDHSVMLGDATRTATVVVDMDDVETSKLRAYLALPDAYLGDHRRTRWQRRLELPLWQRLERRVERTSDAVVVCSDLDRVRLDSARTVVVPNCYPDPGPPVAPRPEARRMVLVANFDYEPNVDAAAFLARDVMPLVRRRVPDAHLSLVGRNGRERLSDLSQLPSVEVVGTVADPVAAVRDADIVTAPVRFGGGTRIKLLEAFAVGVPAVSTTLGCEGLDVTAGEHLLVADSAGAFADACVRLLGDPVLRASLAQAARERYDEAYRPEVAQQAVEDLARRLMTGSG